MRTMTEPEKMPPAESGMMTVRMTCPSVAPMLAEAQNELRVDIAHRGINRQQEERQHVVNHADQRSGEIVD